MVCTFFGNRDTPQQAEIILEQVLIDLIENKNVNMFYIGNQGNFDYIARKVIKRLKQKYNYINYNVVLAYFPNNKNKEDYDDTIYPDGLETVPYRFAINKRNKWMIEKSEYVITFVFDKTGGAEKFKQLALKKGKTVIELTSL